MTNVLTASWFYWAIGIAIGLPLGLVLLTEWQRALRRRGSALLRPVTLLKAYLLPLGALPLRLGLFSLSHLLLYLSKILPNRQLHVYKKKEEDYLLACF